MDTNKQKWALEEKILTSNGVKFLSRDKLKKISFNIFIHNTEQLLEVLEYINDPEYGINLFFQKNTEFGSQIHTDINRHMHNFVAASMTLVEHTRNLMREFYANTNLLVEYETKIQQEFRNNPISSFVQGLRNYMVHRALPPTSLRLHIDNTESPPVSETSAYCNTIRLLEWDGWTKIVRVFLESSDKEISINGFVSEYKQKIVSFHHWLDGEMNKFHENDLLEISMLKKEISLLDEKKNSACNLEETDIVEIINQEKNELLFSDNAQEMLLAASKNLLGSLKNIELKESQTNRSWSKKPFVSISKKDFIKTPVYNGVDQNGTSVLAFIEINGKLKGFDTEVYDIYFNEILNHTYSNNIYKNKISAESLNELVLEWCHDFYLELAVESLSEFFIRSFKKTINTYKVFFPVANLEIEEVFKITENISLETITADCIRGWINKANYQPKNPTETKNIEMLFQKMTREMQGVATLTFIVNTDVQMAIKNYEPIAKNIVDLLRFFLPCANRIVEQPFIRLLGEEYTPIRNIVVSSETTLHFSQFLLSNQRTFSLSSEKLADARINTPLNTIEYWIDDHSLNDFELTLRHSIITYSKGMLLPDFSDKLLYIFDALENILLKHGAEYKYLYMSKRVPCFFNKSTRYEYSKIVKKAYHLRNDNNLNKFLNNKNLEILQNFSNIAYDILLHATKFSKSFRSKIDFIGFFCE